MDIIFRIIGYLSVGVVGATVYNYCYKNIHIHLYRCTIISGVNAFGAVVLWMALLSGNLTTSHIAFGVLSGSIASISFYLLGLGRRLKAKMDRNEDERGDSLKNQKL